MGGGKRSRDQFRAAKTSEISANAGQTILLSGLDSRRQAASSGEQETMISGNTIVA